MNYRVYLDVLFVVNFVMDFIIISITASILHLTTLGHQKSTAKRGRKIRVILYIKKLLAALTGSMWVCIVLMFHLNQSVWYAVSYLGVPALMIYIVMGKNKIYMFMKGVGILYLVTFSIGGLLHALYYYTTIGYMLNTVGESSPMSSAIGLIAGGTVIGAPGLMLLFESLSNKISVAGMKNMAVIENNGAMVTVRALCDTGNSLCDPFFNEPVNVVEAKAVEDLITSYAGCGYHLIPYSSIGSQESLIPVVRFDKLTLYGEEGTYTINKPLFALYSGKFASTTEYRVIIHPKMMSGTKV